MPGLPPWLSYLETRPSDLFFFVIFQILMPLFSPFVYYSLFYKQYGLPLNEIAPVRWSLLFLLYNHIRCLSTSGET